MIWTTELDTLLISLWTDGKNLKQIEDQMNIARAVIMKRLRELSARTGGLIENLKKFLADDKDAMVLWDDKDSGMPQPFMLSFFDMEHGDCKWPYGNREIFFCGLPAEGPYCRWHSRRAYAKVGKV